MYKWEDLVQANETIRTTSIKGKEYAEVPQRIKAFRMLCPDGAIVTELISNVDGVCIFKATVLDGQQNVLGTGTAYEKESSSFINKTSYIENCETSAVGRALGMCGFGIDTSVASAEEVTNAINNQNDSKPKETPFGDVQFETPEPSPRDVLVAKLKEKGIDIKEYGKEKGLSKNTTPERYEELIKELG